MTGPAGMREVSFGNSPHPTGVWEFLSELMQTPHRAWVQAPLALRKRKACDGKGRRQRALTRRKLRLRYPLPGGEGRQKATAGGRLASSVLANSRAQVPANRRHSSALQRQTATAFMNGINWRKLRFRTEFAAQTPRQAGCLSSRRQGQTAKA